jgi:hypothetical protein
MAILLSLTQDQALVLFEWLSREDGKKTIPIAHPAEEQTLWALEAQLERQLSEPLQPDYQSLLAGARERILSNQIDAADQRLE